VVYLDTSTISSNFKGSNILVTGGNGFVGSHIIKRLVGYGACVTALVREHSNLWRLENEISNIRLLRIDITDVLKLLPSIRELKPEYVFHMAAYGVDPSDDNYIEAVNTNVLGTINLIQALSETGCKKLINTGSGMEYGCFDGYITEHTSLNPNNAYGSSKAASTLIAHQIAKENGIGIITLRPFGIFGEYESSKRLFSHIILSILKGTDIKLTQCEQYRDYIYVEDIVDGFLMAALKEKVENEIFNIASGISYQLRYYIELILNCLDSDRKPSFGAVSYRKYDLCRTEPDISKIKGLVEWEPKTSLKDGINNTVQWFKANLNKY
jgi:nucleoside-diphosphate-sugar epimerase